MTQKGRITMWQSLLILMISSTLTLAMHGCGERDPKVPDSAPAQRGIESMLPAEDPPSPPEPGS
jgi:hypothetical protein